MAKKRRNGRLKRRDFLRKVTADGALAGTLGSLPVEEQLSKPEVRPITEQSASVSAITYPRVFKGRNLRMIAFPLGGIGTGSIALGGRGQLTNEVHLWLSVIAYNLGNLWWRLVY